MFPKIFDLLVFFSASLPLAIVLVGIIGGLILTAALILMLVLCRRHLSRNCGAKGFKSGSDISAFTNHRSASKRDRKSGSDSDNSGDYKIDVRTTSSLSNQDSDSNWDELEDRPTTTTTTATTLPSSGNISNNNNNNSGTRTLPSGRYPPQVMTNGGLVYHQHYANGSLSHLHSSLQRPGSDYVDSGRLLTAAAATTSANTNMVRFDLYRYCMNLKAVVYNGSVREEKNYFVIDTDTNHILSLFSLLENISKIFFIYRYLNINL